MLAQPKCRAHRAARPALLALAGLGGFMLAPIAAHGSAAVSAEAAPSWGTAPEGKKAGRVLAMAEIGDRLYIAGEFTGLVRPGAAPDAAPVTRPYLAALDIHTGELVDWGPTLDGPVKALEVSTDRDRLYIGGDFDTVGGTPARNLAAVDLATGALDRTFAPGRLDSEVRALALDRDRLYVGGDFTRAFVDGGAERRPQLAAVAADTGALLDWTPPGNHGGEFFGQTGEERASGDGVVYDLAVSRDGRTVYAAGTFLDFGGRKGLVAFDAGTGRATRWQPRMERPTFGLAVSPIDGRTLYAATGGPGGRLYAFDPGGNAAADWEVKVDGDAVGVVATSRTVYLLGHYDYIVSAKSDCYRHCPGGPARRHLAAFDAATGELDPWAPVANTSTGPYTGAAGDGALYVGGEFTEINGAAQPGVAIFPGTP